MKRYLTKFIPPLISTILYFCFVAAGTAAESLVYEAKLPSDVNTTPLLCEKLPCAELFPSASHFSARKGKPSYVEAIKTDEKGDHIIGYVFLSTDVVDIPAYSGKPIVTLIGLDTEGYFIGSKILKHSEPILLLGIPEKQLLDYVSQYRGLHVTDKIEIGKKSSSEKGTAKLDGITGATVTLIAQNQVMSKAGLTIARQTGLIKSPPKPKAEFTKVNLSDNWQTLVEAHVIERLRVDNAQVGLPNNEQAYIDLHFAYLNHPSIGNRLLGQENYQSLMTRLKTNEHAVLILGNGTESFKGSGFVRGGIYDRIQITQGYDSYTFRDLDYLNVWGINVADAPSFKESGIFIIRDAQTFSPAYPWSLLFLGNKMDKQTAQKTFASFEGEYWLPDRFLADGRPFVERPEAVWKKIWRERLVEIVLFSVFLLVTIVLYARRDSLVRRSSNKDRRPVQWPRNVLWIFSVVFVGFFALAQPSITQVLTWIHAVLSDFRWDLFLSDPLIFLFWWFIAITVIIWGRGLFCGWMCPFGSMTELMYKIAGKLGLKKFQFKLPYALHQKLRWLKYLVFFMLLAVSFVSMPLAEQLAEIEPFKTTFFIGILNRTWPFTLFVTLILGLSIFTERPFCKYLCPLGACLAIPTKFRFDGLKRKSECQTCSACAKGCGSLAIDAKGNIDHMECLLCLDCMIFYYDDHACPPLAKERKRRERLKLPLTGINSEGYFIPITIVEDKSREMGKP